MSSGRGATARKVIRNVGPAPPMRDDRSGRLRATRLTQLLVDITGVDREAAGRAERFAVRPGESGNDRRFDHPRHPTSNSVD